MKGVGLLLGILLAVAGPVVLFGLLQHGINYQDEPYQMLNAAEYSDTPLAPLSAWAGYIWSEFLGFNLLMFRIFASLCTVLTMVLACVMLYRRTRKAYLAQLVFGAGVLWLALEPMKSFLYGWDNLSTLFLVADMVLIVSYIDNSTLCKAISIGIIAALAVMSRIPNVAVLVVAEVFIIIYAPAGKKTRYAMWAVGSFMLVLIGVIMAIYGSIGGYLDAFAGNVISGHDVRKIMAGYAGSLPSLLLFSCYASAVMLTVRIFPAVGTLILAIIVLILGSSFPVHPFDETGAVLATGLFVATLILCKKHRGVVTAVGAVAICATVGSDMGFEKLIALPSVVVLMANTSQQKRQIILKTGAILLIVALCKEYPVLREQTFEDSGFARTGVQVKSTPFAGIYTTPDRAEEIAAIDSIIGDWKSRGGEVLVIGDCYRYAANLISRTPRPHTLRHRYLIDYPDYITEVKSILSGDSCHSSEFCPTPERLSADNRPLLLISTRPFDWRYQITVADLLPELQKYPSTSTTKFVIYKIDKNPEEVSGAKNKGCRDGRAAFLGGECEARRLALKN